MAIAPYEVNSPAQYKAGERLATRSTFPWDRVVLVSQRFTVDGSAELEKHLTSICEKVLDGIIATVGAERLETVLLGGGYGRGEGGVLKTESGDQPYNDLEFYISLRGPHWLNIRRYGGALDLLAERLSPLAKVEVEFKLLPLEKLERSPISMFHYDLVVGHRCLWREKTLSSECDHHRAAEQMPLAEAIRLLMNRCSGLLFAREKLERVPFRSDDADFVYRNIAKAQLAFGDVLLTEQGQYHWSCRERMDRLNVLDTDFPEMPQVRRKYREAVEFKLHPFRTSASREALQKDYEEVSTLALHLWLWLESRRLDHPFASIQEYALSPTDKCPETKRWRNLLINFRTFGPEKLFSRHLMRYPRGQVLEALSLLLWSTDALGNGDLRILRRLQGLLSTKATSSQGWLSAYRRLWAQFN